MCAALLSPRGGTPDVLVTATEIADAGRRLAGGEGLLAVDTERASAYRYDDRAFLVQLRRAGAGTFLIDPETDPGAIADAGLAEMINPLDWVIHAAVSDLPCLVDLGLYPHALVDTEIAGHLLGLPRVNLAAMTEELLGITLAKGHGREDWSTRPLPRDWLDYAALDVELLPELADALVSALAELDRVEWLRQESEAVRAAHAPRGGGHEGDPGDHTGSEGPGNGAASGGPGNGAEKEKWRSLKGVGKLKTPEQLVAGRELWRARDRIARERDISPVSVLPHDVLVSIAAQLPRTERELAGMRGFPRRRRGATSLWMRELRAALDLPRDRWPERVRPAGPSWPHHRNWDRLAPAAAAVLASLKAGHEALAADLAIAPETIFRPSDLREVAWILSGEGDGDVPSTDAEVRRLLAGMGARPWQIDLMAGMIAEAVLLPRRNPLD